MYKIGELSLLCRLPVKTLRYYDSIGLLVPDSIDRYTGYRYYSAAKIGECNRITQLKQLGFSLEEIRQYRDAAPGALLSLIAEKELQLQAQKACIEQQLKNLNTMKETVQGDRKMYHTVIRQSDSITVAAKRQIFESRADASDTVCEIKAALGDRYAGSRYVIINHETEFKEQNLDLTVGAVLSGSVPQPSAYETRTVSFPDETAVLICAQTEIVDAYESLLLHIHDSGYLRAGAVYEIYYDDATVELKVPVEKAVPYSGTCTKKAFENDEAVIGKWTLLDIVPTEEQFYDGHPKCDCRYDCKELYFLPGGEGYWIYEGWTRGSLYSYFNGIRTESTYEMRTCGNRTLLFLREHLCRNGTLLTAAQIMVYEKADSHTYTKEGISVRDNTDLPMLADQSVLGEWRVRDFYRNYDISAFSPSRQNRDTAQLYLRILSFDEDGSCVMTTEKRRTVLPYTKGFVLNHNSGTASAYEIRVIDGKEYLFFQWKSGDYSFGGGRINMYVLTK